MADKFDASAAKALDKLTDGADAIIAKLGTLADKYGGEVIDTALWVVRVDGASAIVGNLVGAAGCGGIVYALYRVLTGHIKRVKVARGNRYDFIDLEPAILVPTTIGMIPAGIGLIACALSLVNVWHWVAIFEPKLWVAKRLLGL